MSSGGRGGSVSGVREEELLEGFDERPGGVGGERIHTLHRHLVLDALRNDVALCQRLEVDLVVGRTTPRAFWTNRSSARRIRSVT
jgi:hypothetical protein